MPEKTGSDRPTTPSLPPPAARAGPSVGPTSPLPTHPIPPHPGGKASPLNPAASAAARAPHLGGVLETALYVASIVQSRRFYEEVMGLQPMLAEGQFVAYRAGPASVLLLFGQGAAKLPAPTSGGIIPAHDALGQQHIAFAIQTADLALWQAWLANAMIQVESHVYWPRGGQSLYFRDPDGHSLELATPGLWPIY